jgi:hypothetical protein
VIKPLVVRRSADIGVARVAAEVRSRACYEKWWLPAHRRFVLYVTHRDDGPFTPATDEAPERVICRWRSANIARRWQANRMIVAFGDSSSGGDGTGGYRGAAAANVRHSGGRVGAG